MMVPSAEVLARACVAIAPRFGLSPRHSMVALRVALREADHLADDLYDAPAALLFALGRYPRCFAAFRTMSVLAVESHARSLGFLLTATPAELGDLLVRVTLGELAYEDVRARIVERMLPFGG